MERVVDRSDLLSEHSTPPPSPCVQEIRRLDDFEFIKHDEAPGYEDGQNEDEELDFLLFAPTNGTINSALEVPRIRVQTPPLTTGEPGFTNPNRDESYYFTHEPSDDAKARFDDVAVTAQDVLARSESIWPGSSYPWKVLRVQNTKGQRIIISNSNTLFAKLSDNFPNSKRKRPGKKARIQVRTKLATAKTRQDESRKAAEQKEAEEREKRTRRNREKKVKKKQREKAKKVETAPAEEEQVSQSPG